VSERVVVIVPNSPDRCLAPNARVHGYGKADATARHRRDAAWATRAVHRGAPFSGPVQVAVHVRWGPGERIHDLDSCAVMTKPYIDGLVDGGLMTNDSQMTRLVVSQEAHRVSKTTGDVVVAVEAISKAAAGQARGDAPEEGAG